MTAKRITDASAYIRSLAQLRGRNADWGEQAVREAVSLSAQRSARRRTSSTLVAQDVPDLLRQVDGREVPHGAGRAAAVATRQAAGAWWSRPTGAAGCWR